MSTAQPGPHAHGEAGSGRTDGPARPGGPGAEPRRPGSARRLFATTVLLCEAFVVFFAGLVAYGLELADPAVVAGTAAGLATLCVLAGALLRRGTIGYVLGTAVQVLMLLAGFVIDMMLLLGVVFGALWIISWQTGGRIDVERKARYEAEVAHHRGT